MLATNIELEKKSIRYREVQFVGFAISTTPGDLTSIEELSDDGRYLGYNEILKDITHRLTLLEKAVEQSLKCTSPDRSVLKVFVVPEFYFRGNKGAYIGASEAVFNEYFKEFTTRFLAQERFQNWLFVLGTLLTSEQMVDKKAEPTKSLYTVGDSILDIYYCLHPKQANADMESRTFSKILKMLDETDNNVLTFTDSLTDADAAFVTVLKDTLNNCDSRAGIYVQNRCYIVEGGKINPRVIQVSKKYKSKEDFILNARDKNYTQSITRYNDIPERSEVKQTDDDDYSIFSYGGLRFGIEICLDHSRGRLISHLKTHKDDYVDIQIVTSCGMDVRPGSVISRTGGFVFNCDGEYVLKGSAENGEHCHTILQTVTKCTDGTVPAVLSEYVKLDDKSKPSFMCDKKLYPCKTYALHIYPSQQVSKI